MHTLGQRTDSNPSFCRNGERYHVLLKLANDRNSMDTIHQTNDKRCLRAAVFAVTYTKERTGLTPAIAVFQELSRPARTLPAL